MPKLGNIKNSLLNLLNIGSTEETNRPAIRVRELSDLTQTVSKRTSLDPISGHQTIQTTPPSLFTSSGHFMPCPEEQIVGECVACREESDEDGEPDRVTLVPRALGGGGICVGCGRVYCSEHGKLDDEGKFWCEDCHDDEGIKKVQKAVIGVLVRRWSDKGNERTTDAR